MTCAELKALADKGNGVQGISQRKETQADYYTCELWEAVSDWMKASPEHRKARVKILLKVKEFYERSGSIDYESRANNVHTIIASHCTLLI